MSRSDIFNQLADQANRLLKEGPQIQHDLEEKLQVLLQNRLSKMNVVSREEFDAQQAVLHRTRAKLEAMEAQLVQLGAQLEKLEQNKES